VYLSGAQAHFGGWDEAELLVKRAAVIGGVENDRLDELFA
jgi:hypothetical protein